MNTKDQKISDRTLQILYGKVKNWVQKMVIHCLQSSVKVIVVALCKSAGNSEDGNIKLVVWEWTEPIIA